ncbi:tRNA (adenosine(37)-N6)-threonylcarbamoyltransferase complex ATPase subunit type 1 TsaE [Synechococcus sp. BS56D]|uniref:tRNA (adenosine(37)-N6)-threonylcarbamoyltransferase complex ATPase subunit type 1 TsaE n=1 Tax=Synechococcus sp. BS56D TaxID=2055944 RepID=UPI001038DBD3|nr:tRNA (adenosine(37)-N6)-threonylcarbamoyltransferase complex ATPase subunit type 1 TsaE [Synechococcus sp. BS56D]TCD57544.1 tRNA (adenosine(37)-N6)-threonylcarbamoyltransferase complex ATPase subunit type 1 TsaE [Synechococcus sp. BS56D]
MDGNLCRVAEASGSPDLQSTDGTWILEDLEATRALGLALARRLPARSLLLLQGPLGAGKTSLVQGLAAGLGIGEPITSPTFALAQHYPKGTPPLVHLDLYRLELPSAADDLFLQEEEEATAMGALLVVEWPERLSLALPDAWRLELSHRQGVGAQAEGRLARLCKPVVQAETGAGA